MSATGKEYEAPPDAILNKGVNIVIKDLKKTLVDEKTIKTGKADAMKFKLTQHEVGIQGDKNLIVPTFGMTSTLFSRHCEILRQLRRRVDLLKQAYR